MSSSQNVGVQNTRPEQTGLQKTIVVLLYPFETFYVLLFILYLWCRDAVLCIVPRTPKSLENEIVLVTGGAQGIGREICREITRLEKNLTVITWDVDEKNNLETVDFLKGQGIRDAFAFTVDVSDSEQVAASAKKIQETIGDVTILFNNAGIAGNICYSWDAEARNVEKLFAVNILSHCWTLREFLPKMIEKGRGHVVETCSVLGFLPLIGGSSYVATKHAIRGFFACVKQELRQLKKKHDVCVSLVYPYYTTTNMTANVDLRLKRYFFYNREMSPQFVASKIVEGMRHRKAHIYVPGFMSLMHLLFDVIPEEAFNKLGDFAGMPNLEDIT